MLRDTRLSDAELAPVARRLREACRQAGAIFILNRRIGLAAELAPDYVHLGKKGPSIQDLHSVCPQMPFGWSAHDEHEVVSAFAAGAAYVTLSPIFPTPSKPDQAPLGL